MVLGRRVGSFLISFHLYIAFLTVPVRPQSEGAQMEIVRSWRMLDFDYSTTAEREEAIRTKDFIPGPGMVLLDSQLCEYGGTIGQRLFVTIPRFASGVPVTFGYVTDKENDGNSLIAPYPSWEMQKPGTDCSGLVSVYRVAFDSRERLWILDSGVEADKQTCPPKLLVYSPETDQLVHSYVFPKDQYVNTSIFIALTIDERNDSDQVFVYIADVSGFGLIVYDERNNRSWRIEHDSFKAEPDNQRAQINNESFDLADGIFGLTLGPINLNDDRILYFHPFASLKESWVQTSVIRNFELFENDPRASPESFKSFETLRPSQSTAEASASNGVLFYGLVSEVAIGCWRMDDSGVEPDFGTIATKNTETLQFPSSVKIVKQQVIDSEDLWVVSIRFQKLMSNTLTADEVNYRILRASVDDLVSGTKCQP